MAEKPSVENADGAPVAELLFALSEVVSGNPSKTSRQKLRHATRDAEKALRGFAGSVRTEADSDVEDDDDSADYQVQQKTADALEHLADIMKATRAVLTSSKHGTLIGSLPQFLWQSSMKATQSVDGNQTFDTNRFLSFLS